MFAWPLMIGAAMLIGLVSGLTGNGPRDVIAWLLVGLAPLILVAALSRRDHISQTRKS